ncbi:MAG: hypothetical protein JOZ32_16565 [Bryobacterales bacterium]|nr:hypothetical protein [Bryobacterales bacterium]
MSKTLPTLLVLAGTAVSLPAQWVNYPTAGTPRTSDGKPNLTAPARKTPDGKPDLSGVWQAAPTPVEELTRLFGKNLIALAVPGDSPVDFNKYLIDILADFKPDDAPLRPEFADLLRQRRGTDTPLAHCLPLGIPGDDLLPGPFKIIQTPGLILLRNEFENTLRQIYTDGRKPPAQPEPQWLGYSVGKWEADTLVIDTIGFNDKSWLDGMGHPHSEALHVVERFRRRDFGHMDVQVTIDDPKMYSKAFSVHFTENLLPDSDVMEYFCSENERDVSHLPKD